MRAAPLGAGDSVDLWLSVHEPEAELFGHERAGAAAARRIRARALTYAPTLWESGGDGAYALGDGEREHCGTTVALHLKPENAADALRETGAAVLRGRQ